MNYKLCVVNAWLVVASRWILVSALKGRFPSQMASQLALPLQMPSPVHSAAAHASAQRAAEDPRVASPESKAWLTGSACSSRCPSSFDCGQTAARIDPIRTRAPLTGSVSHSPNPAPAFSCLSSSTHAHRTPAAPTSPWRPASAPPWRRPLAATRPICARSSARVRPAAGLPHPSRQGPRCCSR